MSENTTTDPKFVPAASSLEVVGMKVSQIRTDDALIAFVHGLAETRTLTDAQEAVAVYVARKRGHEFDWILTNLGIEERTAKRREIEGMAILRIGEITRTVSAIRTGELGIKAVDEITSVPCSLSDDGTDERILALETMAAAKRIKANYVTADKKELSDETVANMVRQAKDIVAAKVEPLTAATLVAAVPVISEDHGAERKVTKRAAQTDSASGPMGLEFHLRAALRDMKKLAEAAEAAYVPTTQDYKALFDLVTYLDLSLDMSPELVHALEVAEKAGL